VIKTLQYEYPTFAIVTHSDTVRSVIRCVRGISLVTTSLNCFHKGLENCGQVFNCLLFGGDAKIYGEWNLLLTNYSNQIQTIFEYGAFQTKWNVNTSFCRKANWDGFDYKLRESSVTGTDRIRDLGVLTDTKVHLKQQVDIFSHAVKTVGVVWNLNVSFSSMHSLLTLYSTLVRPTLQYASVAWNYTTSSYACKLERIQRSLYVSVVTVFLVT
jgi:hypothetical protein